jgi:hypothetical protein
MKIVINTCYGGFSLSAQALIRLQELKGKPCYFFKDDYSNSNISYTPVQADDLTGVIFWSALDIDTIPKELTNDWLDEHYVDKHPDDRTNPLLIQVIEELGELADGSYAKLTVIEIPDDADWEIAEYDGYEHVAEKHRTWP